MPKLALLIFSCLFTYSWVSGSEVLLQNFDQDSALSSRGGYSFGAIDGGMPCCPFEYTPGFQEQTAQSFTLKSAAVFDEFDVVLFHFLGNTDAVDFYLVGSSPSNPGGSSDILHHEAPDLGNVLESWSFDGPIGHDRQLFSFESVLRPTLQADTRYWLVGAPNQSLAPSDFVDMGWVAGTVPLGSASVFARRNNYMGGEINDIEWSTGDGEPYPSQAGYSLRVIGTPVDSVPEPSTLFLCSMGLFFIPPFFRRLR